MVGDFSFMLSLVEAFLVLSAESEFDAAERPSVCLGIGAAKNTFVAALRN
jgi:hypothetical protein